VGPVGKLDRVRTQAERSEGTIAELLRTARSLFAERGFAATSIEDIVGAAGVTRGALYHHFADKRELFQAVLEEEEKALVQGSGAAAARKRGAWSKVEAGCDAFLDACLDKGVQQIVVIDAPAVLGWEAVREIEFRYWLSTLIRRIEEAMADGTLAMRPPAPLAHLIFGALCEGSFVIAGASDQRAAMQQVRGEMRKLLRSLAKQ
jgi:AcrR family transcriptional regulator